MKTRRIVLASRPKGSPTLDNFRLEDCELPPLAGGDVLVANRFLSLDPYMRGRMDEAKSYAKCVALGEVMIGGTVGDVIESRHPKFQPGDAVVGTLGWQEHATAEGGTLQKIDPNLAPLSAYLGTLGMPGVTAWVGLLDLAQPKAAETVVVSAASGAVGSVVGQLAKLHGARAVGIAGGPAKCAYVRDELGFDACIDYKAGDFADELKAACPKGIDVYFENVGGMVLDTVLRYMNPFGRISVCGLISQYNAANADELYGIRNFRSILMNRLRVQGFIVSDRMELWPRARKDLAGWYRDGRLKYRETVADGLANAPAAFLGLLRGENLGKQLVRL